MDLKTLFELPELSTLEPSIANFQKQVRESRLSICGIAAIFLIGGIGLMLTVEPPAIERKWWFGFVVTALSTTAILLGLLSPATWIKRISRQYDSDIDAVLDNEAKIQVDWRIRWNQYVISFAILLPLQLVALWITLVVNFVWGLLLFVPFTLFAIFRMQYLGNQDAEGMSLILDAILVERGFCKEPTYHATQLKRSFVSQELHITIENCWRTDFEGGRIVWFRYSTQGNSVSSGGIACSAVYFDAPSLMQVARSVESISTLYFDKKSQSIYGTFKTPKSGNVIQLAHVPWQYLNGELILRLNEKLLTFFASQSNNTSVSLVEDLIRSSRHLINQICEDNYL